MARGRAAQVEGPGGFALRWATTTAPDGPRELCARRRWARDPPPTLGARLRQEIEARFGVRGPALRLPFFVFFAPAGTTWPQGTRRRTAAAGVLACLVEQLPRASRLAAGAGRRGAVPGGGGFQASGWTSCCWAGGVAWGRYRSRPGGRRRRAAGGSGLTTSRGDPDSVGRPRPTALACSSLRGGDASRRSQGRGHDPGRRPGRALSRQGARRCRDLVRGHPALPHRGGGGAVGRGGRAVVTSDGVRGGAHVLYRRGRARDVWPPRMRPGGRLGSLPPPVRGGRGRSSRRTATRRDADELAGGAGRASSWPAGAWCFREPDAGEASRCHGRELLWGAPGGPGGRAVRGGAG